MPTVVRMALLLALPLATTVAVRAATTTATQPSHSPPHCTRPWTADTDELHFEQELARIGRILETDSPPLDKAHAHLAAANLWLTVPAGPAATACLLGVATDLEISQLHHAGTKASEHIAAARALLASDTQPDGPDGSDGPDGDAFSADAARAGELLRITDELAPFAELMATFGIDERQDSPTEAWAVAARGLATVREAPDTDLAASARLWQAFAWAKAGRLDRAKIVLPAATVPPETHPYDFVSRLLRCRILADEGHFIAASTLLTQVQAACPNWFREHDLQTIQGHQSLALFLQCHTQATMLAQGRRESWQPEAIVRIAHLQEGTQARLADMVSAASDTLRSHPTVPIRIEPPAVTTPSHFDGTPSARYPGVTAPGTGNLSGREGHQRASLAKNSHKDRIDVMLSSPKARAITPAPF
jgi:hypothetical protein